MFFRFTSYYFSAKLLIIKLKKGFFMKKFLTIFTVILFAVTGAFAHGVLLMVEDNGDGTIFIEAGLSTGGGADGAEVILKEKATGRPILTQKYPEEGALTVEQPKVPYTVTVRLSEGHEVTKNGPAATEKTTGKPTDKANKKEGKHSHDKEAKHSHDDGKTYHDDH